MNENKELEILPPESNKVTGENGPDKKSLEFSREAFLNNQWVKDMYQGLNPDDPKDYRECYERAYKYYLHNRNKPVRIEPEPVSPESLDKVTEEALIKLEITLATMFAGGLATLHKMLGKKYEKPREEE